ncbi:MAG TPA: YraN family protein [Candidatus Polarisedimenticolia bacterium]|nr:YraN family protein [Candidatus Polarisedimenticolia bacterium]
MLARVVFAVINFAARKGLIGGGSEDSAEAASRQRARRTGVRGETYAYWYLRRHGYILVARNYTLPGIKGEIDMVGYDGPVLAFVEVKTRALTEADRPTPEEAVNRDKRRHLVRMARHFSRTRRVDLTSCRFDVLAIEAAPGARPTVRLHKGAFTPESR